MNLILISLCNDSRLHQKRTSFSVKDMQIPQIFGPNSACEKSLLPMIGSSQPLMLLTLSVVAKIFLFSMEIHATWLVLSGLSVQLDAEE